HHGSESNNLQHADANMQVIMDRMSQTMALLSQRTMAPVQQQQQQQRLLATRDPSAVGILRCSSCHKAFNGHFRLLLHSVAHASRPYTCPYANCKLAEKIFTTDRKMRNHIRNVHGKSWQCAHL